MIFGWIINNFFQPSNIWMLKRRKYLELFCETIMNFLLLQNHFIHLFQSILRVTPGILAKIHCRKRALTELLFHQVRIYHIFAAKILRLLNFIQGGNSSDSGFSFSNRLCLASAWFIRKQIIESLHSWREHHVAGPIRAFERLTTIAFILARADIKFKVSWTLLIQFTLNRDSRGL